jgi:nitrosocyanin
MAPAYTLLTAMVAEGANIWLPSTLILEGQVPVTLTLRNVSKVEHGFAIEAMGVREIIPAGETKTVVVTPGESGVYRYHCPLHKGHVGGQLLID